MHQDHNINIPRQACSFKYAFPPGIDARIGSEMGLAFKKYLVRMQMTDQLSLQRSFAG